MKYAKITGLAALAALTVAAASPHAATLINKDGDVIVRSVSVNGTCRRELVPDKAMLTMTAVAVNARDLKSAVAEAVKNYESARAQIQKMKLKDADISTSEYNVQPMYDWNNGKQTLRGYQARVGLKLETSDIDRMGDVMAIAAESNMKDVGQWQLIVSPDKYKQAAKDCLADAVADARSNAERMASAVGAKLGGVLSIAQEGAPMQPPVYMQRAMMKAEAGMAADSMSPTIEAGKQDINIGINASFMLQ